MNGLCDVCQAPATVGNFCTACLAVFKNNLTQIPWLFRDLEVTITKQAKQTVPGPGGGERSLPLNLGASDAAGELRAVLRGVATRTRVEVPGDISTQNGVVSLVVRVTRCMEDIARRVDGPDWAHRTAEAVKEAERAIDSAPERKVIGNCDCGQVLATSRNKGTLVCRKPGCGKEWDIAHSVASRVVDTREHVATPEQAAGLISTSFGVKLTREGVKNWIKRGTLTPVEEGTYRVRIGDVMDLYESKHGPLPGRAERG